MKKNTEEVTTNTVPNPDGFIWIWELLLFGLSGKNLLKKGKFTYISIQLIMKDITNSNKIFSFI